MRDVLLIKKEWLYHFRDLPESFEVIDYTEDTFNFIIQNVAVKDEYYITVIHDFHPELINILNSIKKDGSIIRIEPEPFTHPICHFSGFFLFSILLILRNPELVSTHSYMTIIPGNIFNLKEIKNIALHSHSASAFNIGILAFGLYKKLKFKRIHIHPDRTPEPFYEGLKTEFINTSATLMKVLEITNPTTQQGISIDNIPAMSTLEKLKIPYHSFLTREFITGFRKYAMFWKKYLYEDHFALLSAIYTGKEGFKIDDRAWIRIMLELLNISIKYEDKTKLARRILPIYTLYLKSIGESNLKDKIATYLEILQEELTLSKN